MLYYPLRYNLLVFVLNVFTILITVVIINVYFREPAIHRMPAWVKAVFIEVGDLFLRINTILYP